MDAKMKKVNATLSQTNAKLGRTSTQMSKVKSKTGGLTGAVGKLSGAFAAVMVAAGAFRAIGSSLKAWDKQVKAVAQVEIALKSTGNLAQKTIQQLKDEASALQKETLFGDEEILAGATAQLLTFTNIAGKEFSRTQKSILDVATRLAAASDGTVDLKSVSLQLGKALNDPVANLSALSRSGIQFSKEQKTLIKSLWETGKQAEAQNVILSELEKQYGGSAQAAAKAGLGPMKQLGNVLGDISEKIGGAIGKHLPGIARGIMSFISSVEKNFHYISDALQPVLDGYREFRDVIINTISPLFQSSEGGLKSALSWEKIGLAIKEVTIPLKVVYKLLSKLVSAQSGYIKWLARMNKKFNILKNLIKATFYPLKKLIEGFKWLDRQLGDSDAVKRAAEMRTLANAHEKLLSKKKKGIVLNSKELIFLKNYKRRMYELAGKKLPGGGNDVLGGGGLLSVGGDGIPGDAPGGGIGKQSIQGAAPKIFNIRVDKLVEKITIRTQQFEESKEQVKNIVVSALSEALADFQIAN